MFRSPRVSRILGSDTSDTGTESSHVSEHVSSDNKHYRRAWHIHHSKADSHLRQIQTCFQTFTVTLRFLFVQPHKEGGMILLLTFRVRTNF